MVKVPCAITLALAFLQVPVFAGSHATPGGSAMIQPDALTQTSLDQYLLAAGKQFGCYFTVETRQIKDENSRPKLSPLQKAYLKHPKDLTREVSSIQGLMNKLQTELPDVVIKQDSNNPRIIHVIDASLERDPGYVLNQAADVQFSGFLFRLPAVLCNITGGRVVYRSAFSTTEINSEDLRSTATFVAQGQPIRNILSDYVPLIGHAPILWKAETAEVQGQVKCNVYYYSVNQP